MLPRRNRIHLLNEEGRADHTRTGDTSSPLQRTDKSKQLKAMILESEPC